MMAAAQGASLRELMERMGHSSTRAALIYLHATRERDEAIAAGMGQMLKEARRTSTRSGTRPRKRLVKKARTVRKMPLASQETKRAGDGNRTRMTSLEGCHPAPSGTMLTSFTIQALSSPCACSW
jgi:hypothetical protein